MTQFREHFTSAAVLHQPSVEQGRQRPAQPPFNTTTRGQKGGTQGKNSKNYSSDENHTITISQSYNVTVSQSYNLAIVQPHNRTTS